MNTLINFVKKNPAVLLFLTATVVVLLYLVFFQKSHHRVETDPPPSFNKTLPRYVQRGNFDKYYFITIPCSSVDSNTEEMAHIELFKNRLPESVNFEVTINNQLVTSQPPVTIKGQDYQAVGKGECLVVIGVRCLMGSRPINPADEYKLVFHLRESSKSGAAPSYGGCDENNYTERLRFYECIEGSGSHDADHLVITELSGGTAQTQEPVGTSD